MPISVIETKSKVSRLVVAALICAAALLTPLPAEAAANQGGDYPNEKCQRNNKDGSTTTGQCSSVCKNLDVSTTKDVDSGYRTCKEAALTVHAGWGLVPVPGSSLTQFVRFNDTGEVQACTLTKPDVMQCHNVTIQAVNTKSR